MRTHTGVQAARLDEADMTAQSALRTTAEIVAQQWADHDRVRSVVGVRRSRRDFGAAVAGLAVVMAATYARALTDE